MVRDSGVQRPESVISVLVTAKKEFSLPADLAATTAYFRDFSRTLADLPHLTLVSRHGPSRYRILYTAAEAGVYRVALYCDLQVRFDEFDRSIRVTPLGGIPPVPPSAAVGSLVGQGRFSSLSFLRSVGSRTDVDYSVQIEAELPKPVELGLVPDRMVERLVERVVRRRLREITDAFALRATP